jgi:hypothetical protein
MKRVVNLFFSTVHGLELFPFSSYGNSNGDIYDRKQKSIKFVPNHWIVSREWSLETYLLCLVVFSPQPYIWLGLCLSQLKQCLPTIVTWPLRLLAFPYRYWYDGSRIRSYPRPTVLHLQQREALHLHTWHN